jgi:lipopolysaccharide/colanic/teichoic acid biosynthesis glycosyltransferase
MQQPTLRSTVREEGPKLEIIRLFRASAWCRSRLKRGFDIVVATVLLIPVAPLIPLIILLVKLDSSGPAFYTKHRAGLGGDDFCMYKFRTMAVEKPGGIYLTRAGDMRITRIGRLLRKWKLDEIPQLWNVIRGDMSIVGPRPHLRRLLGNGSKLRDFLSLRPGMTGVATIHFRHEEDILPRIPERELETYYIQNILPKKMQLDMDYAETATFVSDLKVLFSTLTEVMGRRAKERRPAIAALRPWGWSAFHNLAHDGAVLRWEERKEAAASASSNSNPSGEAASSAMPIA